MRTIGSVGGVLLGAVTLFLSPLALLGAGCDPEFGDDPSCDRNMTMLFIGVLAVGSIPLVTAIASFSPSDRVRQIFQPLFAIVGSLFVLAGIVAMTTILVPIVCIPTGIGLIMHSQPVDVCSPLPPRDRSGTVWGVAIVALTLILSVRLLPGVLGLPIAVCIGAVAMWRASLRR